MSCAATWRRIATHLIRDYPQYYHYDSETTFTYDKIKQGNRNTLVWRAPGRRAEDRAYRSRRLRPLRQQPARRPAGGDGAERDADQP